MKAAFHPERASSAFPFAGTLSFTACDTAPETLLAAKDNRRALSDAGAPQNAGHRHWCEGVALAGRRDWRGAVRAFGRATRAAPQDALYWVNLSHAQRHAGNLRRAVAAARRCLRLEPSNPLALRLLGECEMRLHRYSEAADAFAALQASGNTEPEVMVQHASVLQELQHFAASAEVLLRAVALKPELVDAHALLANAMRDQGLKREAVECLKTVLALSPDRVEIRSRLSFERRHICDWSELTDDIAFLTEDLTIAPQGLARVLATFSLLSLPIDPALQLVAARGESLAKSCGVQPLPPIEPLARKGPSHTRIRLGCISYDFREHPVSQLMAEWLEGLDRSRFELFLYSAGPDDASPLRRRVEASANQFVDIRGMCDAQAAQRMRTDGVDVALDLMGLTRGARPGVLARRPAPLQVAYLGFPGSTGAECIDYLIGDPLVTPLDLAPLYSEKLAQLPGCFQPNGRWRPLPQHMSRADAGLPEGAFVMCAFNHTYKILPEAFDVWCAVLRDVPHAVLWLKETNAQLQHNVQREAIARDIDPQRILFARKVPYAQHFSRLALADAFVDTWPYNAHTTAADALWAGVPVVTVYGNGFASRVAASVLNAVGLAELAFSTPDDYRKAILALALEPGLLANYRQHLVSQRMQLPLFDSAAYTRDMERLLERMWSRWLQGLPVAHLPAAEGLLSA